jgi:hypothetical protein
MIIDYNREYRELTVVCIASIRSVRIFTYNNITDTLPSNSNFSKFYQQYIAINLLGFKTFYNNLDTYRFLNNGGFTLEPIEKRV